MKFIIFSNRYEFQIRFNLNLSFHNKPMIQLYVKIFGVKAEEDGSMI